MYLNDFIEQQLTHKVMERKLGKVRKSYESITHVVYDSELTNVWYSNNEDDWDCAIDRYWSFVKKENLPLEKKMDELNPQKIASLSTVDFHNFLHNEYFVWKYTAKNRLATTRQGLEKYKTDNNMRELNAIQNRLFSFRLDDIRTGLEIASSIHGLGIAGASGLLALLFPKYFGTVDQFVVKALRSIEGLPQAHLIMKMSPEVLKINDGVILIEAMKERAQALNNFNNTDYWTPRHIDKVLWTFGR